MIEPEKIVFSESLNRLFPKAEEIFSDEIRDEKVKYEVPILNFENIINELNLGEARPEI